MPLKRDNPTEIWFLTAIHVNEKKMLRHPIYDEIKVEKFTRTFGYYSGYQKALKAVEANTGNMCECLYNYLVMEKIGEGVHAIADDDVTWFKWNAKKNGWVPCARPEWAKGIINWALG